MAWTGATPEFLAALRNPHTAIVRVDAQRNGAPLEHPLITDEYLRDGLPVVSGSVTVDTDSMVRRQLDITLADVGLNPRDADSPLAPYGTELVVSRGIQRPNGQREYVPLMVARLDEVSGSPIGDGVKIIAPDRARTIADAKFLGPRASSKGMLIITQIQRLVTEVVPQVVVVDRTASRAVMPRTVWEEDRWEAIELMAKSIGAEVFFAPDGQFIIRKIPMATSGPVWSVNLGSNGVLSSIDTSMSRADVCNGVVALGERADDLPPVRAVVLDDDQDSPTYWGGEYGQVPYLYTSDLITTVKQARAAARGELERRRVAARTMELTVAPNPMLDVGDVISVQHVDRTMDRAVISQLVVPLDTSAMTISCKSGHAQPLAPEGRVILVPPVIDPPDARVPVLGVWLDGLNDYYWSSGYTPKAVLAEQLDALEAAGVTLIRATLSWAISQPVRADPSLYSTYHRRLAILCQEAEDRDIKVVLHVMDSPPWSRPPRPTGNFRFPANGELMRSWATWMGSNFGSRVYAWQVWGSPNLRETTGYPDFGQRATRYVTVLRGFSGGVKDGDAGATVVLGGSYLSDAQWLRKLYTLGIRDYFDVLAWNPFMLDQRLGPEADDVGTKERLKHAPTVFQCMDQADDSAKPVWWTGLGWAVHSNAGIPVSQPHRMGVATAAISGDMLKRSFDLARTTYPRVRMIIGYAGRVVTPVHGDGYTWLNADGSDRGQLGILATNQAAYTKRDLL